MDEMRRKRGGKCRWRDVFAAKYGTCPVVFFFPSCFSAIFRSSFSPLSVVSSLPPFFPNFFAAFILVGYLWRIRAHFFLPFFFYDRRTRFRAGVLEFRAA